MEDKMMMAIEEARRTMNEDKGGPFGAVITDLDGNVISVASNLVLESHDPTAHAEVMAIRKASEKLGTHDLSKCILYATGYPCPMCLSAIIWSNIRKVYYGTNLREAEEIGFRDDFIYEYLNGTVISRNVGYWFNTITIDKGSYSGVEKDMVVINAKGLIGKVIRTTTFTSDVRLITTSDTNNKISVSVSNGGDNLYGLINSFDYGNNYLEVEGISNTKNVSIGNKVYTSGLGGIFPSGILIGEVSDITTDSYDLAKLIKVRPSVDFNDINYVSVLKRKGVNNDN